LSFILFFFSFANENITSDDQILRDISINYNKAIHIVDFESSNWSNGKLKVISSYKPIKDSIGDIYLSLKHNVFFVPLLSFQNKFINSEIWKYDFTYFIPLSLRSPYCFFHKLVSKQTKTVFKQNQKITLADSVIIIIFK
jgi:hypothetical protein